MTRRIAVLIAASRFGPEARLDPLEAPERDVDLLAEVVDAARGGVYETLHVLKNQPCDRVRRTINRVLREAGRDDQVLFYYSGHGKLDRTGKLCLAMTDTVQDELESTSVRIGDIKDYIEVSNCKQVMLILDCCYSGAAGKDFVARTDAAGALQAEAQGTGICIMSASNSVQTALEDAARGMGVFTRHLIEGMRSGDADQNGDGLVTFDELYEYVRGRVVAEGHQKPQKWAIQAEGSLVLARSERRQQARARVREKMGALAASGELPEQVLSEVFALLHRADFPRDERERAQQRLLEELAAGTSKPAAFGFAWGRLSQVQAAPPPQQQPQAKQPPPPPAPKPRAVPPAAPAPSAPPAFAAHVPPDAAQASDVGPGLWRLQTFQFGMRSFLYELELRPDGSVGGTRHALAVNSAIESGRWHWDPAARLLALEIGWRFMMIPSTDRLNFQLDPALRGSAAGLGGMFVTCQLERRAR